MSDLRRAGMVRALGRLADIVVESVAESGPAGMPSGTLYGALVGIGMELAAYEALIDGLVSVGRLRRSGHVLYAVTS